MSCPLKTMCFCPGKNSDLDAKPFEKSRTKENTLLLCLLLVSYYVSIVKLFAEQQIITGDSMNRAWTLFKSYPYISNVVGYTTLFATADLIQQSVLGGTQGRGEQNTSDIGKEEAAVVPQSHLKDNEYEMDPSEKKDSATVKRVQTSSVDWCQTARVALVGLCFHSNFNYHWLRALEKMFPGGRAKAIAFKVFLDQLVAAPATISAFYIGLSTLEGREDVFEDWKNKFWMSYKTGVVYWSTMQAVNFSLVPPVARTVFVGGISLGWTVFLCHFRQQGAETNTHTFINRTTSN